MVLCGSRIGVPATSQVVASLCAQSWAGIDEEADGFSAVPDLLGSRFISCFASLRKTLHHVLWKHQGYCLACAV